MFALFFFFGLIISPVAGSRGVDGGTDIADAGTGIATAGNSPGESCMSHLPFFSSSSLSSQSDLSARLSSCESKGGCSVRETEVCTRTRKRQRGLIRGAAGDSPSEEDQDFHQLAKDLLLLQDLPGEGRGLSGANDDDPGYYYYDDPGYYYNDMLHTKFGSGMCMSGPNDYSPFWCECSCNDPKGGEGNVRTQIGGDFGRSRCQCSCIEDEGEYECLPFDDYWYDYWYNWYDYYDYYDYYYWVPDTCWEGCKTYYTGCNVCDCKESPPACFMELCSHPGKPQCIDPAVSKKSKKSKKDKSAKAAKAAKAAKSAKSAKPAKSAKAARSEKSAKSGKRAKGGKSRVLSEIDDEMVEVCQSYYQCFDE